MNETQRMVAQKLGANRLDYSNRQPRTVPNTYESGVEFIHRANTAGPNSQEYADLMSLYQGGWDVQDLPSTSGGGVPQSIHQTAADLAHQAETSRKYFTQVDPLLEQIRLPTGESLAQAGPERASQYLSLLMADSHPQDRPHILRAQQAIENSGTSSLGVTWQTPDAPLVYEAPSSTESDPSGYSQWREGVSGHATGLQALMLQAQHSDSTFDGISNTGAGGGVYDHHDAMLIAEIRSGNLSNLMLDGQGMHQAEAGNISQSDVISPQ